MGYGGDIDEYINEGRKEGLKKGREEGRKSTRLEDISILLKNKISTFLSRSLHLLSEAKGGEEWRRNHQM